MRLLTGSKEVVRHPSRLLHFALARRAVIANSVARTSCAAATPVGLDDVANYLLKPTLVARLSRQLIHNRDCLDVLSLANEARSNQPALRSMERTEANAVHAGNLESDK